MPLPVEEVTSKVAAAYNVGVVQCPVPGEGRIERIHGTSRDFAIALGPKWLVEVKDDIPWMPTFDIVTVENGWVAILAEPGSTEGFVRSRTWTLRLEWPAAETGKTVTCSKVEPVPERVVVGQVTPRDASMYVLGCTDDAVEVARDGTFVVDAKVPCSLWLETDDAHRTQPIAIPPGTDKLKLEPMEYAADPLQNPDRSWTDAGKAALGEVVRTMEARMNKEREMMANIESELPADAKAQHAQLRNWNAMQYQWTRSTQFLKEGLAGRGPL
ncbi:MAG: hypothetical protein KTR31_06175 [Myxococcales bacterium]|nr:hypothetical protein [Myxococcales bacterium]